MRPARHPRPFLRLGLLSLPPPLAKLTFGEVNRFPACRAGMTELRQNAKPRPHDQTASSGRVDHAMFSADARLPGVRHVAGAALTMEGLLLISSPIRSSPGTCRALAQFSASLPEKSVRARGLVPRVAEEYVRRVSPTCAYAARRLSQVQHSAPVRNTGRGKHDSRPAYALHRRDRGKDLRFVQ